MRIINRIKHISEYSSFGSTILLDINNQKLSILLAKTIHLICNPESKFIYPPADTPEKDLIPMLKNLSGQTLYIENIFAYSKNMQSALSEVLNKKSCIQVITSCGEKDITDLYYETQRENFHLSLYYQIQEYAIGISRENKENNQYLKEINTFLLKEKLSNL